MEELVIKIKDRRQRGFLLEILSKLDFVEVVQPENQPKAKKGKALTPDQQAFLDDLKEALRDVELHLGGLQQLPNARQALQTL